MGCMDGSEDRGWAGARTGDGWELGQGWVVARAGMGGSKGSG